MLFATETPVISRIISMWMLCSILFQTLHTLRHIFIVVVAVVVFTVSQTNKYLCHMNCVHALIPKCGIRIFLHLLLYRPIFLAFQSRLNQIYSAYDRAESTCIMLLYNHEFRCCHRRCSVHSTFEIDFSLPFLPSSIIICLFLRFLFREIFLPVAAAFV